MKHEWGTWWEDIRVVNTMVRWKTHDRLRARCQASGEGDARTCLSHSRKRTPAHARSNGRLLCVLWLYDHTWSRTTPVLHCHLWVYEGSCAILTFAIWPIILGGQTNLFHVFGGTEMANNNRCRLVSSVTSEAQFLQPVDCLISVATQTFRRISRRRISREDTQSGLRA